MRWRSSTSSSLSSTIRTVFVIRVLSRPLAPKGGYVHMNRLSAFQRGNFGLFTLSNGIKGAKPMGRPSKGGLIGDWIFSLFQKGSLGRGRQGGSADPGAGCREIDA